MSSDVARQTVDRRLGRMRHGGAGLLLFCLLLSWPATAAEPPAPLMLCAQLNAADGAVSRYCMPRLELRDSLLQASLIWSGAKELSTPPSLLLDGKPLAPARDKPLLRWPDGGLPLDVVMVVQTAGTDEELWPEIRTGLGQVLEAVYKKPDSRVGVFGYGEQLKPSPGTLWFESASEMRAAILELKTPTESLGTQLQLVWALSTAVTKLSLQDHPERMRLLLLLTDGMTREKPQDQAALYADLAEVAQRAGVAISVIMSPGNRPSKALASLPLATGGLLHTPRREDLAGTFSEVANNLVQHAILRYAADPSLLGAPGPRERHAVQLGLDGGPVELRIGSINRSAPPEVDSDSHSAPSPPLPSHLPAPRRWSPLWYLLAAAFLLLALALGGMWRWPGLGHGAAALSLAERLHRQRDALRQVLFGLGVGPARVELEATAPLLMVFDQLARQTYVLGSLPYSIGNEIRCDLVLPGLKGPLLRCSVEHDRRQGYVLVPTPGLTPGQVLADDVALTRPVVLRDRLELRMGGHRLVFFLTPVVL